MKRSHIVTAIAIALLLITFVTACQRLATPSPTTKPDPPSPTPSPSPTATPTNTPTPTPPKELTICQAEEPNTLFIYGGPSRAARNVLEAIYDGPIDSLSYRFQPVILEKLPNLSDDDATMRTVRVDEGDQIVDIKDQVVDLRPGVTLLNADGDKVTFEEGRAITTTQMVVTFTIRSDVKWADGEPLTAEDSRYAFQLAGELDDPALRRRWRRTQHYEVIDEQTVVWTSIPGYRELLYFLNFYHPLPKHVWGDTGAEQMLNAEVAHRKPLGWGAFAIKEWVEGDHITMVRNPNYFRASEELPHLDRVTFRFVSHLQEGLDGLLAGQCDLITQDLIGSDELTPLLDAADAGSVQLISSPSSEWEHLDFSIESARWRGHPDFFADVKARQAVAYCVDRERIAREAFPYADAVVADSYVTPEHPIYADDQLKNWSHNPGTGRSLLKEAGWQDEDGDDIREAHGVPGIVSGTPFSITLLTTDNDPVRKRVAHILKENLSTCGIELGIRPLPPEEFYADGPDGPVFGRQFDLALFSWLNGFSAPCELYLSSEIPREENWWATSNNPGYASDDYDAACQSALNALPGTGEYQRAQREAQRIFSTDLPVLPLYFVPKMVAARPTVSGVTLDPSEYVDLWNIEAFDVNRQ